MGTQPDLPVLDAEAIEALSPLDFFEHEPDPVDVAELQALIQPAPAPHQAQRIPLAAPGPEQPLQEQLRGVVNLRKGRMHVSPAQMDWRADWVHDLHLSGLTVREIAARSPKLLGPSLAKSTVGQLLRRGQERYDAQTAERRARDINASQAKLDWAQSIQQKTLTRVATAFSEEGSVELLARAIADNRLQPPRFS